MAFRSQPNKTLTPTMRTNHSRYEQKRLPRAVFVWNLVSYISEILKCSGQSRFGLQSPACQWLQKESSGKIGASLTAKICCDSGQEFFHIFPSCWEHSNTQQVPEPRGTQDSCCCFLSTRGKEETPEPALPWGLCGFAVPQTNPASWKCSGDCRRLTKPPDYGRGFQDNFPLKIELWCNLKCKKCEVKGEKWIHRLQPSFKGKGPFGLICPLTIAIFVFLTHCNFYIMLIECEMYELSCWQWVGPKCSLSGEAASGFPLSFSICWVYTWIN